MELKRLIGVVVVIQTVLSLAHLLLYETWTFSPATPVAHGNLWVKLVLGFLSGSFVAASLLAFYYTNAPLRAFYRVAAVWIGLVSFLFLAALSSWIIFGVAQLAGLEINFHRMVQLLFGRSSGRSLRCFQRKLDADYSNDGAAREPAGSVAGKESCADQRCAFRTRAKRQFSAAHGGEDFEGRAGRDFYCRRFI